MELRLGVHRAHRQAVLQRLQSPDPEHDGVLHKRRHLDRLSHGSIGPQLFRLARLLFRRSDQSDLAAQNTTAAPVINYNRIFDIDPAKSHGVGGEAQIDFNLSSISAALATYQAVGAHDYDAAFGLYDICASYTPGVNCLLRGIGGDYTRVTLDASWKRNISTRSVKSGRLLPLPASTANSWISTHQ